MSDRERFRVQVLGPFRILSGNTPITIPAGLRRPQEVLQALIAFGGTDVRAGVLIDALWPDSEGDAAYHALETALYRLRSLLGAREAVRMQRGKVSLSRISCGSICGSSRRGYSIFMVRRPMTSKESVVSDAFIKGTSWRTRPKSPGS